MDQTPKPKQPTPTATKVGFVLWGVSLVWWFAYYSNYSGAFGLLDLKLMCITGATDECVFFRERMGRTIVPTYYPIFWYVGLIALAVGAYQSWTARRAK
jgi:hypothetical protein